MLFLPEDLGTYLVVGEGIGAGERGSRVIWAPQKMMIQHRSQARGREREHETPRTGGGADISVNHNSTVSSWLNQEGEFGARAW